MTANMFKERYYNYKKSFTNEKYEKETDHVKACLEVKEKQLQAILYLMVHHETCKCTVKALLIFMVSSILLHYTKNLRLFIYRMSPKKRKCC